MMASFVMGNQAFNKNSLTRRHHSIVPGGYASALEDQVPEDEGQIKVNSGVGEGRNSFLIPYRDDARKKIFISESGAGV